MNIYENSNWEFFFDNHFISFNALVEKHEYMDGIQITYTRNNIYVICDLNLQRNKIKKLEFGRNIKDENNETKSNWMKGNFKFKSKNYVEFVQTSFYGENGNDYELNYSEDNKKIIYKFLSIPCEKGWIEKEYNIKKDIYYKVTVSIDASNFYTVILKDEAEQDIPMFGDLINQWLRVKLSDSFFYNSKRTVKQVTINPMSKMI